MNRLWKIVQFLSVASIAGVCSMFSGCGHEPVGAVLVYEFEDDKPQLKQSIVEVLNRRLIGRGKARAADGKRVEVDIYGKLTEIELNRLGHLLSRQGTLEFAILANRQDHEPIINGALKLGRKETDVRQGPRIVASWRSVGIDRETELPKDVSDDHGQVVTREGLDDDGNPQREFLVMLDPEDLRVTGKFLTRVYKTNDENGALAVGFTFNTQGRHRFAKLTHKNRPNLGKSFFRRLAILFDEEIHSAPNINEVISNQGIISGRFSSQEIDELITMLNADALPCRISNVKQRVVE